MRYNLTLTFNTENPERIFQIFGSEAGKKDRSEIKIEKENKKINFRISANDSIALKASVNIIIKILKKKKKTENLVKNG